MSKIASLTLPFSILALMIAAPACGSSSEEPPVQSTPSDAGAEPSPDAPADAPAESEATVEAGSEAEQPDAQRPAFALFVASDFAAHAQLAAIDLSTNSVAGRLESDDQDTIVAASSGRGFLLHRKQGTVTILDEASPWLSSKVAELKGADAAAPNPYSVVVAAGSEGYVIAYGANRVPVVDLASGQELAAIELSAFADNLDGLVDAFDGVHDQAKGRLYIGLQRIDQNEFGPGPDYVGACHPTRAAIIGIDTTTRELLDLNGAADGLAIELQAANPSTMVWDDTSRSLVILGVGCATTEADGGTSRSGRGVERVLVDEAKTSWMWQSGALDRPAALLWLSPSSALVALDDETFTRHWWHWDPATSALGQELQDVPLAPVHDGAGSILGLSEQAGEAGKTFDVVRYDVSTQTREVLASGAFSLPGLNAYSSAVIR